MLFIKENNIQFIYMSSSKEKKSIKYTLDQFFKKSCAELFPLLGYDVQFEQELITGAKRIDVLLLKQQKLKTKIDFYSKRHLQILDYFKEHNLLSYKSFKDHFSLKDIQDCVIYYQSYLQITKTANETNTTISLFISGTPKKFLEKYKKDIIQVNDGIYRIENSFVNLHVINIEAIDTKGVDGAFLYAFCKKIQSKEISMIEPKINKKVLALVKEIVSSRLYYFEGVKKDMGAVADITRFVQPKLEEAERKGRKEGRKEGREEGRVEGVKASQMFAKGKSTEDIIKQTGLTKKQLKALKLL